MTHQQEYHFYIVPYFTAAESFTVEGWMLIWCFAICYHFKQPEMLGENGKFPLLVMLAMPYGTGRCLLTVPRVSRIWNFALLDNHIVQTSGRCRGLALLEYDSM
jgi:hypothetical protein